MARDDRGETLRGSPPVADAGYMTLSERIPAHRRGCRRRKALGLPFGGARGCDLRKEHRMRASNRESSSETSWGTVFLIRPEIARMIIPLLCLAGLGPVAAAEQQAPIMAAPTITVDEVSRGQKGYGMSVFAGTEPERFEVEVLGVIRNSTPELSYILARLTGQDLERSGVVAGMSGSPVYLDDRLAGAVAFSYLFGLDAIAGITPIGAMRRLSELPAGVPARRTAAPPDLTIDFEDLLERDFPQDLLVRQIDRLQAPSHHGARPTLQWTASGFGAAATALLGRALGDIMPAGAGPSGSATVAAELNPGSAVAAVLVRGDLNLAAHGTVTDRTGDEVLAFGHPMFSLGPVSLPLAPSEVVTVIANVANSFKVSNAGAVVGAFDQDREAGVRGRLGLVAPTTPLAVRLRGLSHRDYRMEVANLPQLRPILLAISALGALNSGSYSGGFQGIDLDARIAIEGHGDLRIRQSFDGDQAAIGSVIHLLGFAAFLEFNTLAEVEIEAVEVELTQVERPHSATLIAAYPERTRLEPGHSVAVTLELQAFRGDRFRRQIEIEVPAWAPDGKYIVLIGDGTSMDAVRLSLEHRQPTSFDQALALMRSFRSRRELVIYGLLPAPGLAVAGEVMPNLPGSMRAIFAAASAGAPLWYDVAAEKVEIQGRPLDGVVRLDFEIRRRAR